MSYSHQFETDKAIYRLFRTTHWYPTVEDILTPERIETLDGIVLEVTGDDTIHNPPENIFNFISHSKVIEMAESLGERSPAVYVVDVHMVRLLTADLLLDLGAALAGGALALSGVYDLIVNSRKPVNRRAFLKKGVIGLTKLGMGLPLGTYDKAAMIGLGTMKGEMSDHHPFTWDYFDLFVPHMVVGRDAVYARTLEDGVVPLLYTKKEKSTAFRKTSGSLSKVRLDIHCGAGHKRITEFIQDRDLRDEILKDYARDGYSVFDNRYLHVFFEFDYDPFSKKWIKKEYSIDLFRDGLKSKP